MFVLIAVAAITAPATDLPIYEAEQIFAPVECKPCTRGSWNAQMVI